MSTRIEKPEQLEPVNAGASCSVCWGIDKPFGDGETPSELTVIFENIEKGAGWFPALGEPIDGTFTVQQTVEDPCIFRGFGVGGSGIFLAFVTGFVSLSAETAAGSACFFRIGGECVTVLGNEGVVDFFEGGTATIRIPEVV